MNDLIPSSSAAALSAPTNSNANAALPVGVTLSGGSALVAYTGPAGTIADVASSTPPDRISVYEVRPGDTLSGIAGLFGVSVNTIVWANSLGSARTVHPGDTLIILPVTGIERTIAKGDTLKSLAKKYGADAIEIAEFNGIDPSAPLAIGDTLIIPGGELAAPASTRASSVREPYLGGSGAELAGYFANPLPGAPVTQGIHGWNAVDLGAAKGTPIHAAAPGVVIIVRNNGGWNGGYGNYVVISDDNGTQTLYAHMTHAAVSPGEGVSAGQVIGYVGATGMATGPHLHFEVRGARNPFASCPLRAICEPQ
ncbi:M23 family metallopeptidase [Candidatus Kaiserbacteria bacterium]|nr:M23 family metallopeptidase [Candidatus Kaiserbacteria bacterium]